jgi:hypothetical protein
MISNTFRKETKFGSVLIFVCESICYSVMTYVNGKKNKPLDFIYNSENTRMNGCEISFDFTKFAQFS